MAIDQRRTMTGRPSKGVATRPSKNGLTIRCRDVRARLSSSGQIQQAGSGLNTRLLKTMQFFSCFFLNRKARSAWRLAMRIRHFRNGVRLVVSWFLREKILENANSGIPKIACFSPDYTTAGLLMDGGYHVELLNLLESKIFPKLKRRSVCCDIGANIGCLSLFFARFFEKVIAIEPHPKTYQLLRFNASLVDNIVPVNKGCSNLNRKATMLVPLTKLANASVAFSENAVPGGGGRSSTMAVRRI